MDRLVVAAIERDQNSIADYDVDRATRLAILKLIGYTEVVHALLPRMNDESSVVLFGGRAKDRPYPAPSPSPPSTAAWLAWSTRWRWRWHRSG